MKHLRIEELKAFFKGRLDAQIDAIARDPKALSLFLCHDAESRHHVLITVGQGYTCETHYEFILGVQGDQMEVVASTILPRRSLPAEAAATSAPSAKAEGGIVHLSLAREQELNAWEQRLKKQAATLKRREADLQACEEELKRTAEQQMEDLARQESL